MHEQGVFHLWYLCDILTSFTFTVMFNFCWTHLLVFLPFWRAKPGRCAGPFRTVGCVICITKMQLHGSGAWRFVFMNNSYAHVTGRIQVPIAAQKAVPKRVVSPRKFDISGYYYYYFLVLLALVVILNYSKFPIIPTVTINGHVFLTCPKLSDDNALAREGTKGWQQKPVVQLIQKPGYNRKFAAHWAGPWQQGTAWWCSRVTSAGRKPQPSAYSGPSGPSSKKRAVYAPGGQQKVWPRTLASRWLWSASTFRARVCPCEW